MIVFDENVMLRRKFNTDFVIEGGGYGVCSVDDDGYIESESCIDAHDGQECWVICNIFCEDYQGNSMTFVYIPDIDFATTVLSKFISQ